MNQVAAGRQSVADGFCMAVNRALLNATSPDCARAQGVRPISHLLLDRTQKMLMVTWAGPTRGLAAFASADFERGDGNVDVYFKGEHMYSVPEYLAAAEADPMMAVPTWILGDHRGHNVTLATGFTYPLANAMVLDLWDPAQRDHLGRFTFVDPRLMPGGCDSADDFADAAEVLEAEMERVDNAAAVWRASMPIRWPRRAPQF